MKLSHTDMSGVTLQKFHNAWQHVDRDGRPVGPRYPTRAEALADTMGYVQRAGWMPNYLSDFE
jgi:hypothetical protein